MSVYSCSHLWNSELHAPRAFEVHAKSCSRQWAASHLHDAPLPSLADLRHHVTPESPQAHPVDSLAGPGPGPGGEQQASQKAYQGHQLRDYHWTDVLFLQTLGAGNSKLLAHSAKILLP